MKILTLRKSGLNVVLLFFFLTTYSQDIHFSQFYQVPQSLNPAITSVANSEWGLSLLHRSQWLFLNKPFSTLIASFEMPLLKEKKRRSSYLGVGLNFFNDIGGDSRFRTLQMSLSLAGIVPIDNYNTISAGIQGGAAQKSTDIDDLTWGNQFTGQGFDPTIPSNEINTLKSSFYPDFAAGLFYEYLDSKGRFFGEDILKFNFGVAYFHANKPLIPLTDGYSSASERLEPRWAFHTYLRTDFPHTRFSIIPSAICLLQGGNREINFGALARIKTTLVSKYTGYYKESAVLFGCHYRINDAIIPEFYLEFKDYIIGISYDINISSLSELSGGRGGIEVSFKYEKTRTPSQRR